MALTRIGSSAAEFLSRSSLAAAASRSNKPGLQLHGSVVRQYPEAPSLALPANVSSIIGTETGRFGSERSRDLAVPDFLHLQQHLGGGGRNDSVRHHQLDARLDSYDCFGALSLNGSMQSNVPQPVIAGGRSTHLNMPGGSRAADSKLLADVMTEAHFASCQSHNLTKLRRGSSTGLLTNNLSISRTYSTSTIGRNESDKSKNSEGGEKKPVIDLTKQEKLKIIIRDYGKTVIVFHVGISLASLGLSYFLVNRSVVVPKNRERSYDWCTFCSLATENGIDITAVIKWFDGSEGENSLVSKIMGEGSTFLIAYALHKLFAPVRITVTIAVTPILVKYLRRKGILKQPKVTIQK